MYFLAMVFGIFGFGTWFGFNANEILVHCSFAASWYVIGRL
ncbi:hypothetical protein [Vibrio phage P23]|nr:hypothetical protein [Vibrio phage P23]